MYIVPPAWVIVTAVAICFGRFTGNIASQKGYDEGQWLVAGLLFGPIALIAAAGLPDSRTRAYLRALLKEKGIEVSEEDKPDKPTFEI